MAAGRKWGKRQVGLQPDGMIRVGCSCYTDEDEIERLIAAVATLSK